MEFIRIQSPENIYMQEIFELYSATFPKNQRRTESEFKALLADDDFFHCNAVVMNQELVGFLNYWYFEDFIFVEHIAVEPPLRGHKLGEKIISLVRKTTELPLVLEVEKAEDFEWGQRRIEFYQRIGFRILPFDYSQPPYQKGGEYIPLHLMSDCVDFATENFERIKQTIYKYVYKVHVE